MNTMFGISKALQKTDPIMAKLIIDTKVEILKKDLNTKGYLGKLCREIIGQQLSGRVAGVIIERFNKLFSEKEITAKQILEMNEQDLRDVGMAWAKVKAIKDLGNKVVAKEICFEKYPDMSSDEVMQNLLSVKGIGPWTAEMFLIFTLGYEDVFSVKDLGLIKAGCMIYKLDRKKKGVDKEILEISNNWKPYRSYASLALWKSLDIQGWWRE